MKRRKNCKNLFQSKYKLTINDQEIHELIVEQGDMCFEDLDTDVRNQLFKKSREKYKQNMINNIQVGQEKSHICPLTILSRKFLRF